MKNTLCYASAESLGISSNALVKFLERAKKENFGLHSVILQRHGKVAMEGYYKPYAPDETHILFSLSKSFTSTAIGFAVQEGLLSIEDKLVDFFPEYLPCEPCGYMKEVKVRNLLSMGSGHTVEPSVIKSPSWIYSFLTSYIEKEPGSIFTYNSAGTYMLSAIVQKVTGQTVSEYLKPRLFDPLGFSEKTWWQQSPEGIDCGGFGLNVTTRDLAKFGQFYLQRGNWNGEQLLNAEWVDLATSKQIDNYGTYDWGCGYGFQFWRCQPEGVYRGDGAFGQYCLVMPKQDAVLVINSSVMDMQKTLDAVWEILLPAMEDAPLAEDAAAQAKLTALCEKLEVDAPYKFRTPKLEINGMTYRISNNPMGIQNMTVQFGQRKDVLEFDLPDGKFTCTVNCGRFTANKLPYTAKEGDTANRVAAMYLDQSAKGGWVAEDTYKLYLYGTYDTGYRCITMKFNLPYRRVELQFEGRGSFGVGSGTAFGFAD